jgi:DNA polymerase I-like protein with 3'-5' exonuclease and polymerase domains
MIQLPLFAPESLWLPPTFLPSLKDCKEIAIDTETRDPLLHSKGPSFLYGEGYMIGICIATDTGIVGYYPIRHPEGNLDRAIVTEWLRDELKANTTADIITANGQYDLGWLESEGIKVHGRVIDIQVMEALIDEENPAGYSLGAIAKRRLGRSKDETLLRQAAFEYEINPKSELWQLPSKYVGPYGEQDAKVTLDIWQEQKKAIKAENLHRVADLEINLTPVLYRMMRQGVRVDQDYAQKLNTKWIDDEADARSHCKKIDIFSSASVAKALKAEGIKIPMTAGTEKSAPQESVTKPFLESIASRCPLAKRLLLARGLSNIRKQFLEGNLINGLHRGRIFPQYVQMHSEEGGTRTGRLSCKNPNAQQFPKRSTVFDAKAIRKCLVPEDGQLWSKHDYWSQEPTLQCHYGLTLGLPGAREVAQQFEDKVKLYTFIEQATKGKCNYDQSKAVVLGRSYGMGKKKMAESMNIPEDTCEEVLVAFDEAAEYIGKLAKACSNRAQAVGYVADFVGRRRRFNLWEPQFPGKWADQKTARAEWVKENGPIVPMLVDLAKHRYGSLMLVRSGTFKAFNGLMQGGSATQTKQSLVDIDSALGTPQMTVHDEISKSVRDERESLMMDEIMKNSIRLLLPVQTDRDLGVSWC